MEARTPDLLFTKQLLYQLSYAGLSPKMHDYTILKLTTNVFANIFGTANRLLISGEVRQIIIF